MKRTAVSVFLTAVMLLLLPLEAAAQTLLVPVGQVIGLQLDSSTVTVAAYDDALGSHARDAGIQIGDEITKIDGIPVHSAQQVRQALTQQELALTVRRGPRETVLHITPRDTADGPRLGVFLRQGIAGIGTVTFYDPQTHAFGTLGHGVSGSRGSLLKMTQGRLYPAQVQSVKRGLPGKPGQLRGLSQGDQVTGTLLKNTPQGVFGTCPQGFPGQSIPTGSYQDIHLGEASIRSTISGTEVQEYSVEILKIYPKTRADCRNFLLKVTDPALLQATGGIVQGMSGSPIIQDGKLIGAVTHVLVNQPDTGYGIFIDNMLEAAG